MSGENDKQKEGDDERMTPEEKERLERQKELERELREADIKKAKEKYNEWKKEKDERDKEYNLIKAQRNAEEAQRKALQKGESIRREMGRSATRTLSRHEGFSQVSIFDAMSRNRTRPERFSLNNGMCRALSFLWLSDRKSGQKTFQSVVEGEREVVVKPLGDFLGSLAKVRGLPDLRLLPAHGPVAPSTHASGSR